MRPAAGVPPPDIDAELCIEYISIANLLNANWNVNNRQCAAPAAAAYNIMCHLSNALFVRIFCMNMPAVYVVQRSEPVIIFIIIELKSNILQRIF